MIEPLASAGTVVCFAVPDESRLFTATLENRRTVHDGLHPLPTVYGELAGIPVTVVHTGVGDTRTAREHVARRLTEAKTPMHAVVSAGYAGALHPGLAVGDLVFGVNHSSPELLDATRVGLASESVHFGGLYTAPAAVETAGAKAALYRAGGALAVDMETAWVAEICAAAGLPLLSLRVISDAADEDFPVPGRVLYDSVRQRPRYLALPAWLALHPGRIGPFVRFVRGLGPARRRLTDALRLVLAGLRAPTTVPLPPPPNSAMGGVLFP